MAEQQQIQHHGPSVRVDTQNSSTMPQGRKVGFLANLTSRMSRHSISASSDAPDAKDAASRPKASLGVLADKETDDVPGTILLLSSLQNKPLGIDRIESHREDVDDRLRRDRQSEPSEKRTSDGKIVLEPQPEDSPNDPLNWPAWRRDTALLSISYYCMLGGGMTTVLAAGFNDVAQTYSVSYSDVALTTGLYMLGLGVGSVIFSPTAILWGKRPVYLFGGVAFILSSIWCALAPSYEQLVIARVFQGIAVSPVECLPSATIAEIFFLHERAFRIGIYTLLLLGGKNLIPLASAAVVQSLGWRWVFWVVAACVGLGCVLLFLFVPETFWDRRPRPKQRTRPRSRSLSCSGLSARRRIAGRPVLFASVSQPSQPRSDGTIVDAPDQIIVTNTCIARPDATHVPDDLRPVTNITHLNDPELPESTDLEKGNGYLGQPQISPDEKLADTDEDGTLQGSVILTSVGTDGEPPLKRPLDASRATKKVAEVKVIQYTASLRESPPVPWLKTLKPFHGRISHAKWWRVACRPFVLYAYPSVLWSAMVYALSVGWLIVLSESVAVIFEGRDQYKFSSIQTGLVYLSPFIGGVLGTAVAGKVSDMVVRAMAARNGGVYEPEFRLVMAIPITITTAIGLIGFGWSAEERDNFMVPTVFFGIISFGCCVGSTTSITFCVDSYRQFAGEALVTLNFSKNILHGLVWSLFFPNWLQHDGSKTVFIAIGCIQIACMITTIPMYIYGKRARMWTVRKKLMERL